MYEISPENKHDFLLVSVFQNRLKLHAFKFFIFTSKINNLYLYNLNVICHIYPLIRACKHHFAALYLNPRTEKDPHQL